MASKVLVVDDDQNMCDLPAVHERQGYSCPHGDLCTRRPRASHPHAELDAVLTDIGMADMSGIELCE